MKKYILLIFLFMIFFPFYVNAEICDNDKITIRSITIENKSDNVEIIEDATATGKMISLKMNMEEVGDGIQYKLIVRNDSNADYELNKNSILTDSSYINYSLSFDDNSNIIKANSSKIVYLKVEYANEVPEDLFNNNSFSENKTVKINLSSENNQIIGTISNPKTGAKLSIIFLIIVLGEISLIIIRKKKMSKLMVLIIGTSIMIPISVFALCNVEIKVESNIQIINNKFTGTIYRNNKIPLSNGMNIGKGYLVKENDSYNKYFKTKEECEAYTNQSDKCEKINNSIIDFDGFSLESNSLNAERYLRHDIENNVIKNTYVCFKDGAEDYCMKGGDNGESYETNSQIIRDYNSRHSYCSMSTSTNSTGCSGSYGMSHNTFIDGKVESFYIFSYGCTIESNGSSYC